MNQPMLNAKRVRIWLVEHEMTQQDLAREASIEPSYLSRFMSGRCHLTPTILLAIHRATGIPLDDLEIREDAPAHTSSTPPVQPAGAQEGAACGSAAPRPSRSSSFTASDGSRAGAS